jgi:hypothetical protein
MAADDADRRAADEAAIERAWKLSGDLHIIADRLALCRIEGEPPPEWVHRALLAMADASRTPAELRRYREGAVRFVRYAAVWEAHHREGLSWEKAKDRAVEMLRGAPAAADRETMWGDYKKVKAAMRAAGVADDDPGYRWVGSPAH